MKDYEPSSGELPLMKPVNVKAIRAQFNKVMANRSTSLPVRVNRGGIRFGRKIK